MPKVAMLFLATKGFPHAPMWSMWFQQVRGLVPKDCVAQAFCPGGDTRGDVAGFNELVQACGPTQETLGEVQCQNTSRMDSSLVLLALSASSCELA